jgi:hypothetical protein
LRQVQRTWGKGQGNGACVSNFDIVVAPAGKSRSHPRFQPPKEKKEKKRKKKPRLDKYASLKVSVQSERMLDSQCSPVDQTSSASNAKNPAMAAASSL